MVGEVGMCRGPSDLPNPNKNDIKLFFRYLKKKHTQNAGKNLETILLACFLFLERSFKKRLFFSGANLLVRSREGHPIAVFPPPQTAIRASNGDHKNA